MITRWTLKPLRLFMVAWVCVGGMAATALAELAEVVAPGQAVERSGSGEINWTAGSVQATGLGAPPDKGGPGQARAMAERAAYTVAVRNLLELVKGVRVDSATLVENYIVTNDVIKTQVSGFVRGAQIVKKDVQADGGVEITVRVPLWGVDSLITPFLNEKAIGSQNLPPEPESGEGPTGLVIDARGMGLKPAFFPMVVDEKGTVIYGPEMIDRATVEKNGAVQYQTLPKGANISLLFGEDAYVVRPVQIALVPREGRRPLKIKGVDKAGALKANILISSDDAKKIRGDAQMSAALRRSKVVVVTDPLIGGMEGRVPEPTGPVVANSPDVLASPIPPWGTPFAAGHPLHFPVQRVPGAPVRHATRSALASAE